MPDPLPDPPIPMPVHGNRHTVVSSCDEDNEDNGMSSGSEAGVDVGDEVKDRAAASTGSHDDLYDAQADEEDAAYVYRHLRSGVPETVRVVVPGDTQTDAAGTSRPTASSATAQTISAYRPRNSDAVLSCPCCFQIVCMDCQHHEFYTNQYRAMFVMGIVVRWDETLRYNAQQECLVRCTSSSNTGESSRLDSSESMPAALPSSSLPIVHPGDEGTNVRSSARTLDSDDDSDDNVIYYTVCCAQCQTTVAALDMRDEVYHFSGCLAASA
jgi:E2F-associated phosphoprotein